VTSFTNKKGFLRLLSSGLCYKILWLSRRS